MRSFFAVCFSLFLGVGICSSQATTLHDASLEFSGVDNPNGQWSYHVGQAFGNPQQPYDTLSVQGIGGDNTWEGPAGAPYHRIGPGLNGHSPFMTRWTVPAGVEAVEAGLSYHQTWEPSRHMRMFIKHNGVNLATMESILPLDNTGATGVWTHFDADGSTGIKFNVSQGDTVDFVVDAYGSQSSNPGVGCTSSFRAWVKEVLVPDGLLTIMSNPGVVTTVSPYVNSIQNIRSGNPMDIGAYPMTDCSNNIRYVFDHWEINSNATIADVNNATTTVTVITPGIAQITAHYTTTQSSFADCGTINASNLNNIIVSPQGPSDGGNFGPETPGTQTAGFAEAFAYAAKNGKKEIFIVGGPNITYNLETTLILPAIENLQVEGGTYTMNFPQTTGDCLVIDDAARTKFRYKFGIVSAPNLTDGSLVSVQPSGSGVLENCGIEIYAIVAQASTNDSVTGLKLNSLNDSKIKVENIEGCNTGIHMVSGNNNALTCSSIVSCDTMLYVEAASNCEVDASFTTGNRPDAVGADIAAGSNNLYNLVWMDAFAQNSGLVLGNQATDNIIKVMNLPLNAMVQTSNPPTNRIIALKSYGFELTTPAMPPSGQFAINDTGFGIVVMITNAGTVSSWSLKDTSGTVSTISASVYTGQSIMLEPGESIRLTYTAVPSWRWRILK